MVYIPSIDGKIGDTAPVAPSSISSMSWGRALGTHWQDATHLAGGEVRGWIPNQVCFGFFKRSRPKSQAGLDSAWRILMNWNWWNYMYVYIYIYCVMCFEEWADGILGNSSSTTWRLTIKIIKVTETKASWTHEGLVRSRTNTWVHHISSLVHPQIHHESMMNPSWSWAKNLSSARRITNSCRMPIEPWGWRSTISERCRSPRRSRAVPEAVWYVVPTPVEGEIWQPGKFLN